MAMTVLERVRSIESEITLNPVDNYEYELDALQGLENDLPVYQTLGTPAWKIQQAKTEIQRLRAWIRMERQYYLVE